MKIFLKRKNQDLLLEATNKKGNSILMDASPEIGGTDAGARPMEVILMGLAGCFSLDILHILRKQKLTIDDYRVEVEGIREKVGKANPFKQILIKIEVLGNIPVDKLKRAAELTFQEYCSVSKMLEKSAQITYELYLNNQKI